VVDDEAVICAGCRRALSGAGFAVDTAVDPCVALRMAMDHDYDLVLLDLRMHVLNGLVLLSRLHINKPSLPVIIITGYPTFESAEEAFSMGAFEYVLKPFSPRQITDAVERVLQRAHV